MHKTFLDLGIIEIRWYSICILLGIIVGYFLVQKEAEKKGMDSDTLANILFYTIIIGIFGARVYYVLFNLDYYLTNISEIMMIWNGGLAIHGGIIAAGIFLIFYCKKKKINFLLLLDILVVGLVIAQAIGRWGNFFNQEAFGRIVSKNFLESIHLPKFIINGMYIDKWYREPTFLYESISSLICFLVLLSVRKIKKLKTGTLTSIYLIWYSITRLVIESFRSDSLMLGNIKVAQLISIIGIILSIVIFLISKKNNKIYKEDKLQIES